VTQPPLDDRRKEAIRQYWNAHLHDEAIATHPRSDCAFFDDLDAYRLDKLRYLPTRVDFTGFSGEDLLEVGCGMGTDLVRFAQGGASVTGVDLADEPIRMARDNLKCHNVDGNLVTMDGERMQFEDASFDVVYAHGVLQYTADPAKMIREIHRVLRPGGRAILMMYNRRSWLPVVSRLTGVGLEHSDAPEFHLVDSSQFHRMLDLFSDVRIYPERFPVPTKLHTGPKAVLYNTLFVGLFNLLPRSWVQGYGWHLLAMVSKRTGG